MPPELPKHYTPAEIASHFGVSERRVRQDARAKGLCRIVGNKIFLTSEDLDGLLELWRSPVSSSPVSLKSLLTRDYEDLLALRERGDQTEAALKHLEKQSRKGRR